MDEDRSPDSGWRRWARVAGLLFVVLASLAGWWAIFEVGRQLWRTGP